MWFIKIFETFLVEFHSNLILDEIKIKKNINFKNKVYI